MTDIEKDMEKLRNKIDMIDEQIVRLLNERAEIVLEIKKLKTKGNLSVYDPRREEKIFKKISARNKGPLYDDAINEIYEKILHCMKDLER